MGELQSSLLCESGSEDAIFTASQALLFYALYDPGVSGQYVSVVFNVYTVFTFIHSFVHSFNQLINNLFLNSFNLSLIHI